MTTWGDPRTKKAIVNGTAGHKDGSRSGSRVLVPALLITLLVSVGCAESDLSVPSSSQVEGAYIYGGSLSATMSGNVAEVTIVQSARDLRRGGTLWAKVGPYVLLFSEETESLFKDFPGLAGIRVVTVSSDGPEVARALLSRDSLNDITWRRAKYIAGMARRDGTRRPTLLEELVEWGEDHTDFTYNPRFSRP